jgi:hypothetical protein
VQAQSELPSSRLAASEVEPGGSAVDCLDGKAMLRWTIPNGPCHGRGCAESGRSYRQRASAYSLDKAMKMDARIRSLDQAVAILRE